MKARYFAIAAVAATLAACGGAEEGENANVAADSTSMTTTTVAPMPADSATMAAPMPADSASMAAPMPTTMDSAAMGAGAAGTTPTTTTDTTTRP
ncbi:MAG TPA: hypothetical protein VF625_12265 [Longimicrobium sp.]